MDFRPPGRMPWRNMLPATRTLLAALLATLALVAGALALLSSRLPEHVGGRTPGAAERARLQLSAGGEPAELRRYAAARRRDELSRLVGFQLGPAGANARESVAAMTSERIALAALPPLEIDAQSHTLVRASALTLLAPSPPRPVSPIAPAGLASLHAPELAPDPPDEQVEAHTVSSDPPSVKEWNAPEPTASVVAAQRRPANTRPSASRPLAARPRSPSQARAAKAAALARQQASRRAAIRRAAARRVARPAAAAAPSPYEGWPADAFLQPPAQTAPARRGRARSLEPQ